MTDYGTGQGWLGVNAPRTRTAKFSVLAASAGLVLFTCGLSLLTYASVSMTGYHSNLLSLPSLGSDAAGIRKLDAEVSGDLSQNEALSKQYAGTIHGGGENCNCDCSKHDPQLHVKAATMLEQVGENVFFGKCSSCPCMKSTSIEQEVDSIGKDIEVAEKFEEGLDQTVEAKIPVDIIMRVGQKGQNGAQGPQGFQGLDGPVGYQGPPGPTGPRGPRGATGPTGPKGLKGPDGLRGPPGWDGAPGKRGITGPMGTEGRQGPRGGPGPDGKDGSPGPPGFDGSRGPRGAPGPTFGKRGPKGDQGPRGPKGEKGAAGSVGPQGFTGVDGPDGADGFNGARGDRGPMGAGCDGIVPSDGTPPKIIDACGQCGGDESECATGRSDRTAHAVGDPHYLTYDGVSFDYQIVGEFILGRHMNDIENQNMQMRCPNPRVRCNIGSAVITRNWNIQFRSEWRMDKIMVNGALWEVNKHFTFGKTVILDVFTSMLVHGRSYCVYYNDIPGATGAAVCGNQNSWGPPLPNNLYMNLYFQAPGRWSSGLSMTGLYGNFDNDRSDDWASISPSTMWWVKDTKNSAFSNPDYRLSWGNRITKKALKGGLPTAVLSQAVDAQGEPFKNTDWTLEDEKRALVQVDEYTAKMRKRLFAKMAADGAILRQAGEKKPASGLGAVELDIMQYPGERPDHLRIEQQMLFRKEWHKLTKPERAAMLAGKVKSNNAVDPKMMCQTCMDGSEECKTKHITKQPQAGTTWMAVTTFEKNDAGGTVKKVWTAEERKKECVAKCLPSRPVTPVICKCWLDCSLGVDAQTCRINAHWNLVTSRTLPLVPAEGDGSCINVNLKSSARFRAEKYRPELWDQEDASNFAITLWWKPRPTKSCNKKTIHSLVYKGPEEVDYSAEPVAIEVDETNCDNAAFKKLPIIGTVAGQDILNSGPNEGCAKEGWCFIGLMKRNLEVSLWIGVPGDGDTAPRKVASKQLEATPEYIALPTDAIFLVSPTADSTKVPYGYVGKMNYIPASLWDNEIDLIYGSKAPKDCGS